MLKLYLSMLILSLALLHSTHTGKIKPYLCSLPHSADGYTEPVQWRCHGQLPLWSYNAATNECVQFRYGGCGGNDNSFYTAEDCEDTCKG